MGFFASVAWAGGCLLLALLLFAVAWVFHALTGDSVPTPRPGAGFREA